MPVERVFLGNEKPLIHSLCEWMWARMDELPQLCFLVPTAYAARQLRISMIEYAEKHGRAVLGLEIITPSHFYPDEAEYTPEVWELLAWMDVLAAVQDWSAYEAAFPTTPDKNDDSWLMHLAHSLHQLRGELLPHQCKIQDVAKRLSHHHDAARWAALAALEKEMESSLAARNVQHRAAIFASWKSALPVNCERLVICGITDAPAYIKKQWCNFSSTILIHAEPSQAPMFDDFGVPTLAWNDRELPQPDLTQVVASPAAGADAVIQIISQNKSNAHDVTLCTCDRSWNASMIRNFSQHAWQVFDPANSRGHHPWLTWLHQWLAWLKEPTLSTFATLIAHPSSVLLTPLATEKTVATLGEIRNASMLHTIEEFDLYLQSKNQYLPKESGTLRELLDYFIAMRLAWIKGDFFDAMENLLTDWFEKNPDAALLSLREFLMLLRPAAAWKKRKASTWLAFYLHTLPVKNAVAQEEKHLDLLGWMETHFATGAHVILCGANENFLPSRNSNVAWLNENLREMLGMQTDAMRAARDAFLYDSLIQSRKKNGRIDILLTKFATDGTPLLPSRLLLTEQGTALAKRVQKLFHELPAAEPQTQSQDDFTWHISFDKKQDPQKNISITALKDYLACPTRYYLKHIAKMQAADENRTEWNARDFGIIMHSILDTWGRDTQAKDLLDAKKIEQYLHDLLASHLRQYHGENLSLALQIQAASLQQRLSWFAERQAERRAEGWRIHSVEEKFELPLPHFTLVGRIDRIDYHEENNEWALWDYKSSKDTEKVLKLHLSELRKNSMLPAHLADDPRLIFTDGTKQYRWTDLQIPLYAASKLTADFPQVGYIKMGDSAEGVYFNPWENFTQETMDSALQCAAMCLEKIHQNIFSPAAAKVKYDDYEILHLEQFH